MKYRYFVSYFYKLNEYNWGYGDVEMISPDEYTSMERLMKVIEKIKQENGFKDVIILNFQLLRIEKEIKE